MRMIPDVERRKAADKFSREAYLLGFTPTYKIRMSHIMKLLGSKVFPCEQRKSYRSRCTITISGVHAIVKRASHYALNFV